LDNPNGSSVAGNGTTPATPHEWPPEESRRLTINSTAFDAVFDLMYCSMCLACQPFHYKPSVLSG
jgi:hypothetical protein